MSGNLIQNFCFYSIFCKKMKSINLKITFLLLVFVGLNACISTTKMSRVIRERMPEVESVDNDYSSYVKINTDSLPKTDSLVTKGKIVFYSCGFFVGLESQISL